ncbi:MAG: methyltransferase domain-containing protein [Rhizobacter sp.]|nr:methyltransferase domain-containing protein [Burkholderiales bacterium]
MSNFGILENDTFDEWLESSLGRYVVAREQAIYDRVLPDLFGFYALQIGGASMPLLETSRVTHKFTLAWDTNASLLAEPDQLPFAENQFDVIVLPHTLEFQALPHEVLREVFRVLRPEGRLLMTGFNPYSLFGIKRYFGRERSGPWAGEFISLSRAKDWLTLLGFDIVGGQLDCYNVPAKSDATLQRLSGFETAGDRWWPFAGGVYFLHAVKRVAGVRLLKPNWVRTPRRKRIAVAVPTRTHRNSTIKNNQQTELK